MQRSLAPDITVSGYFKFIGGLYKIDRANTLTDSSLVALHAMYDCCIDFVDGKMDVDEYQKRMGELSGIYSVYRELDEFGHALSINKEIVDRRFLDIKNAFDDLGIKVDSEIISRQKIYAEKIATLESNEEADRMIIKKLRETQIILKSNVVRLNEENSSAYYKLLQGDLEIVKQDLGLLRELVKNYPSGNNIEDEHYAHGISIYFAKLSWDIDEAMKARLDQFIYELKDENNVSIRVVGFADKQGEAVSNILLSQNRARSVADYIKRQGLTVEKYSGYGRSRIFGEDESNNRRVIVEVLLGR